MSAFDNPQFKKLKKEYYQKLKEFGFTDIEDDAGYIIAHRSNHDFNQRIGFKSILLRDEIFDYYSWAYHHAVHTPFECEIEKKIWQDHSEGKSSREIAENIEYGQRWICEKIKKIREYLRNLPAIECSE